LDPCRTHLSRFWTPCEIEDVEWDHMKLVKDYRVEIELKQNIDAQDHTTMFNCAWDSMKGRYQAFRYFSSSGDVICKYHFSWVKFFHSEMGEELESKVTGQPCLWGHICDQAVRLPNQNLAVFAFSIHITHWCHL
jgi:hypothetical protein